jgi:predicted Zn-dependent protease
MYLQSFLLFVLILTSAGCGTLGVYNPATGHSEFIAISTNQEVQMGAGMHQDILKDNPLSEDQAKVDRLWRIGKRVSQVSDRQDLKYHFYLIDKDELNAFTAPGGNIYVYTGLFDKLKTDDEIAAVLAHEIGHTAAKHTIKKIQAAMGYNLIGGFVFDQLRIQQAAKQVTAIGTGLAMNVIFSAYGRHDEYEADRLGVKYLYLAGYNVQGMLDTLEVLERESKGSEPPLILRTHPYVKDRIEAVKAEIATVGSRYDVK